MVDFFKDRRKKRNKYYPTRFRKGGPVHKFSADFNKSRSGRLFSPPLKDGETYVIKRPLVRFSNKDRFPTIGPAGPFKKKERFGCPIYFAYRNHRRPRSFRRKGFLRNLVGNFSELTYICFRSTANNLFITVVEPKFGKVLLWLSGGRAGFKGPRRTTTSTAEVMSRNLIYWLVRNRFFKLAVVYFSNPDEFKVKTAVNNLIFSERVGVSRYLFKIPMSHNGLRAKKLRRV